MPLEGTEAGIVFGAPEQTPVFGIKALLQPIIPGITWQGAALLQQKNPQEINGFFEFVHQCGYETGCGGLMSRHRIDNHQKILGRMEIIQAGDIRITVQEEAVGFRRHPVHELVGKTAPVRAGGTGNCPPLDLSRELHEIKQAPEILPPARERKSAEVRQASCRMFIQSQKRHR